MRIFSVEKAKEFYVGFLGFAIDWEHRFGEGTPSYIQISRERLDLHLSERHGYVCPGSAVFVPMTGIEEFHREIAGKQYRYLRPSVEPAPWDAKTKVMRVIDPFGNRIVFSQPVMGTT